MDIGFDRNEWRPAPAMRAVAGDWSYVPEWPVLHARLGAAWSARRELAAHASRKPPRGGSFARSAALALASFEHASRAVNPIALGNCKPDDANAGCLAGVSTSGGRG
jgi:hypothetical protein